MSVLVATLCLNEMEWLPLLYAQHRDWPGLKHWVFVESADRVYARENPGRVTADGLSTDGTTAYLDELAAADPRVKVVHHGWCGGPQVPEDQGKCGARQRYLDVAEEVRPGFVFVLDADEFYTRLDQYHITRTLKSSRPKNHAWVFKQRHLWYPPSYYQEQWEGKPQHLFGPGTQEVIGGYWAVPHTRGWRWEPGLRYSQNHNWPTTTAGEFLHQKGQLMRVDGIPLSPECYHLGYAGRPEGRIAKHRYYVGRGEGKEEARRVQRNRAMYVECRTAYEAYRPGTELPHGARVVAYEGPVPEVFVRLKVPYGGLPASRALPPQPAPPAYPDTPATNPYHSEPPTPSPPTEPTPNTLTLSATQTSPTSSSQEVPR